jgi:riboflavin biosynthesis pyrimidine reductase
VRLSAARTTLTLTPPRTEEAPAVRTLIGKGSVEELYAWPDRPWLRVNMVSTVDGAAQGPDGRSGTINNDVDKRVFDLLRVDADALVVGAGTVRTEGYRPFGKPFVVVGSALPPQLEGHPEVRLHTGGDEAALRGLVEDLRSEGLHRILSEGGPTLLGGLLRAGVVDELCCTMTPSIVGGGGKRIVDGPLVDVPLRLASLVEQDGTLLARWLVVRHLAD